jgi:phenylalanyl-tRNA synthetase beta subunit
LFEDVVDVYPAPVAPSTLSFSKEYIEHMLGICISVEDIERILQKYTYVYTVHAAVENSETIFEVQIPYLRLDLVSKEDMLEEVGRVHGLDMLVPVLPVISDQSYSRYSSTYLLASHVRDIFSQRGYKEVMTYVFREKGEVEVLASASDKKFLRTNLSAGLEESYRANMPNRAFLGIDTLSLFEIGTVFLKEKQEMHVAWISSSGSCEAVLDEALIAQLLREIAEKEESMLIHKEASSLFKAWSVYPSMTRDIAAWVPQGTDALALSDIYKKDGGVLLVCEPRLLDTFSKAGRTSYAFRLVFQSFHKTLSDDDIVPLIEKMQISLQKEGFEVR